MLQAASEPVWPQHVQDRLVEVSALPVSRDVRQLLIMTVKFLFSWWGVQVKIEKKPGRPTPHHGITTIYQVSSEDGSVGFDVVDTTRYDNSQ